MSLAGKFPVATQSYFKVLNLREEYFKFSRSNEYLPRFRYLDQFNVTVIEDRLKNLKSGSKEYYNLKCALSAAKLQSNNKEIKSFRQLNQNIYGEPSKAYTKAIISSILSKTDIDNDLYHYIVVSLGPKIFTSRRLGPNKKAFSKYKSYFDRYRGADKDSYLDVRSTIQKELKTSGLEAAGWRLKVISGNCHASIDHNLKIIKIGQDYKPRTPKAVLRIAVHEVYGHALRGPQPSLLASEGFALVLEQLTSQEFRLRRSYRYLAASLGWGIMKKPMDFRQVYEILWRLMVIGSRYDPIKAKQYAFMECSRVFRGGRPDLPGAIYLKDAVYLSANLKVWNWLMKHNIDYDYFIDIIEGRRIIKL